MLKIKTIKLFKKAVYIRHYSYRVDTSKLVYIPNAAPRKPFKDLTIYTYNGVVWVKVKAAFTLKTNVFNRHRNFDFSEFYRIKKFWNYIETEGTDVSLYFENKDFMFAYSIRAPILTQNRINENIILYDKLGEGEDYSDTIDWKLAYNKAFSRGFGKQKLLDLFTIEELNFLIWSFISPKISYRYLAFNNFQDSVGIALAYYKELYFYNCVSKQLFYRPLKKKYVTYNLPFVKVTDKLFLDKSAHGQNRRKLFKFVRLRFTIENWKHQARMDEIQYNWFCRNSMNKKLMVRCEENVTEDGKGVNYFVKAFHMFNILLDSVQRIDWKTTYEFEYHFYYDVRKYYARGFSFITKINSKVMPFYKVTVYLNGYFRHKFKGFRLRSIKAYYLKRNVNYFFSLATFLKLKTAKGIAILMYVCVEIFMYRDRWVDPFFRGWWTKLERLAVDHFLNYVILWRILKRSFLVVVLKTYISVYRDIYISWGIRSWARYIYYAAFEPYCEKLSRSRRFKDLIKWIIG